MEQYNVSGMSCAACSARVEKAVLKVPGVTACSVSLLTNSMGVEGTAGAAEIIAAVEAAGYGATKKGADAAAPAAGGAEDALKDRATPALKRRLIASLVFLAALMYMSMGHMMWGWPLPGLLGESHIAMGLTQLLLTAIIMVINQKFFISGFRGAIHRAPNMDTLVAMGAGAAFLYSTYALYAMIAAHELGDAQAVMGWMHEFYFESAGMILTLITVGKMLEARSKGKTTDALKALMKLAPQTATVVRDGAERTLTLTPAADPRDGRARIGAWVRSSTAGVGTLTFVDPQTGAFGALGHAISDVDTGIMLPVAEGGMYESAVVEVRRSERGAPGEIVGDFLTEEKQIGCVTRNCDCGVFGDNYTGDLADALYPDGLPVGARSQLHTGDAQILTTVDEYVQAYDCEIERLESESDAGTRSMVLHITDPALLARTGGIVQGMSGSPIIQDGKLVGAVTHVFVNDPTRGYGIFIENMLYAA